MKETYILGSAFLHPKSFNPIMCLVHSRSCRNAQKFFKSFLDENINSFRKTHWVTLWSPCTKWHHCLWSIPIILTKYTSCNTNLIISTLLKWWNKYEVGMVSSEEKDSGLHITTVSQNFHFCLIYILQFKSELPLAIFFSFSPLSLGCNSFKCK